MSPSLPPAGARTAVRRPEGHPVSALEDAVWAALDTVKDPCSVRLAKPLGLVGMGLIEEVAIGDGTIRVRMVLTGPGCFFYFQFAERIEQALAPVAEGRAIDVEIDDSVLWTRDRMRTIPIRPAAAVLP